ncbi:hypothetical protein QVD17_02460 [Tagetes erecta]|uniref:Uncharacterized protein n=1 Tax=Tagetes erecta TaxID=13708 RepID=A0AAD8L997_TARER|nr:hypothetical protein QVD17_02460 [Tagetes erecta]
MLGILQFSFIFIVMLLLKNISGLERLIIWLHSSKLFCSPVTRWASVALGAGVGIGSAYSDCSQKFDGSQASSSVTKERIETWKFLQLFPSLCFHAPFYSFLCG